MTWRRPHWLAGHIGYELRCSRENIHRFERSQYPSLIATQSVPVDIDVLKLQLWFQCRATVEEIAAMLSQRLFANIRFSTVSTSEPTYLATENTFLGYRAHLRHYLFQEWLYYELFLQLEDARILAAIAPMNRRVVDLSPYVLRALGDVAPRLGITRTLEDESH